MARDSVRRCPSAAAPRCRLPCQPPTTHPARAAATSNVLARSAGRGLALRWNWCACSLLLIIGAGCTLITPAVADGHCGTTAEACLRSHEANVASRG